MKPMKQRISVTIDENIVDELKGMSERYDRSVSQCINLILKEYLKNHPNKNDRNLLN